MGGFLGITFEMLLLEDKLLLIFLVWKSLEYKYWCRVQYNAQKVASELLGIYLNELLIPPLKAWGVFLGFLFEKTINNELSGDKKSVFESCYIIQRMEIFQSWKIGQIPFCQWLAIVQS